MNFMKLIKVVLFDLDGVILDTETLYMELMLKYNKKNGIPITKNIYIKNFIGRTKKDIDYYYRTKFKEKFDSKKYWEGITKYRNYYLQCNRVKIKNGFTELLSFLKKNGYEIAIVTSNSKKLTMQLLYNAGLPKEVFKFIITRDDVEKTKPMPDLYLKAIDCFDLPVSNFITIEDSNVGIEAALNAGIKVIYLQDVDVVKRKLKNKCYNFSNSLEEIINIIKEMDRQ